MEPPRSSYRLVRHHLAAVPFESLSLHYSPRRTLSVDPEDLFRKIVRPPRAALDSPNDEDDNAAAAAAGVHPDGDRRGGYCMEVNTLLASVLRGLGYDVLSVGAAYPLPRRASPARASTADAALPTEPVLAGQLVLMADELKLRRVRPGRPDEFAEYVVLERFPTEDARVAALRKWFGINLSPRRGPPSRAT
ncbi:unnamed protein product [Parascedosporium putredinis]|uniref:Arylamine N-acetyltransferase n=1 Tax=Parascedosporium putredinis TaxID=1442378 RepID=A0A9P1MAT2_9PEZI|nr:unnamed protein product [Parascedosporium putredinis]CAI7997413.1 unnamed protein product [Parascedosporium putredinis]